MARTARTEIHGKGWTKTSSIDAGKFEQIAKAVIASLTAEPITFTELVARVTKRLKGFEGSVAWYTISVARELEVRGDLIRQEKPVRYLKPVRPRSR